LVWRNRKKISYIIQDYFYLPFFLLFILCCTLTQMGVEDRKSGLRPEVEEEVAVLQPGVEEAPCFTGLEPHLQEAGHSPSSIISGLHRKSR
jgi:hypothetical protein